MKNISVKENSFRAGKIYTAEEAKKINKQNKKSSSRCLSGEKYLQKSNNNFFRRESAECKIYVGPPIL